MLPLLIGAGAKALTGSAGKMIAGSLLSGAVGGISSGLSKRLEGQIAGAKGRYATGIGYATEQQLSGAREAQLLAGTQQGQSQGQQQAFQLSLEEMRQNADSIRQANQIAAMERMQIRQLSFDAEMMNGQQKGFAPAGLDPAGQRDYIRESTRQRLEQNKRNWRTFHSTISGPPIR